MGAATEIEAESGPYELTNCVMTAFASCAYDELDAVRLTRGFLDAPDRYLRAALAEQERA